MAPEKPDYDLYPWTNPVFVENRKNFPAEELEKYRGMQIAWSLDGSRIVASGRDHDELERNLLAAGIDPLRVFCSYVEDG
jgi:hypothetical protein